MKRKTKKSSAKRPTPVTPKPATRPSKYTFDVMQSCTLAPRVPHHDKNKNKYKSGDIAQSLVEAIPIEAFGAVESAAPQRYFTHDNGGRPYLVQIDPEHQRATVRRNRVAGVCSDDSEHYVITYDTLVKRIDYVRFWNGYAPFNNTVAYDEAIGNTLLFETLVDGRLRYLLVAGVVFAFELPEGHPPIDYFSSSLGNNDVPYPYAWSDKYAYSVFPDPDIEYTEIANVAAFVKSGDLVNYFYGHRDWKTGRFAADMTKKQRAALVEMPRGTFHARVIHSATADQ